MVAYFKSYVPMILIQINNLFHLAEKLVLLDIIGTEEVLRGLQLVPCWNGS